MEATKVIAALVEVINAPARPPAFYPLARIKYPEREIKLREGTNGTLLVTLYKWGWEYKHRGFKPKKPPPINCTAIQAVFCKILPDGYTVKSVDDCGEYIILRIWRQ